VSEFSVQTPRLPLRSLSDGEVSELRETVREVLAAAGSTSVARDLESPPDGVDYDSATWRTLAQDIGLAGLGLPEDIGGVGGLVELLAVSEELGRGLAAVPFLSSTVLAGQILLRCDAAATEALTRIAAGEVATAAVADSFGRPTVPQLTVIEEGAGGRVRVSGRASFVTDGMAAALLVVPVSGPGGLDVALVAADDPGVYRQAMRVLDFTRPQAQIDLDGASAVMVTAGGTGGPALSEGLDVALLALSAEQLGGIQEAFDRTLDYIKVRRQFNREIGSFQAIKHRMADALSLVELSRSSVERAGWHDIDPAALAEAAAIASAWCSQAFLDVAAEMVQLHGGIGFTWEHDAHLFFRRARADSVQWGDPTYHRERLAQLRGW